ncbi:MAG: hypothetical protein U0821_04800 [Chloroflexota bacterium]
MPCTSPGLAILVRLIARLEEEVPHVLHQDLVEDLARRRRRGLPPESLDPVLESALADLAVLSDDRRMLNERGDGFQAVRVFRVNHRHPTVRAALGRGTNRD